MQIIYQHMKSPKDKQKKTLKTNIYQIQQKINHFLQDGFYHRSEQVQNIIDYMFHHHRQNSIFQQIYQILMFQPYKQWGSDMIKAVKLVRDNSPFIKSITKEREANIIVNKQCLPDYIIQYNIFNKKNGFQDVTQKDYGHMIVRGIDYLFIKLFQAIKQLNFVNYKQQINQQYEVDDLFYNMSRNPYIVVLWSYMRMFNGQLKLKLIRYAKLFFIDQILLKHRKQQFLKENILKKSEFKMKPHYFFVILLLLREHNEHFQQRPLWLYQLIQNYSDLIRQQNKICIRYLFRIFIYIYNKNQIQTYAIDSLQRLFEFNNPLNKYKYSIQQYQNKIVRIERGMFRTQSFDEIRKKFIFLIDKVQPIYMDQKLNFHMIKNISCFLVCQIANKNILTEFNRFQNHQESLNSKIQRLIVMIIRNHANYIRLNEQNNIIKIKPINLEKIQFEIKYMILLFEKAYKYQLNIDKFDQDNKFLKIKVEKSYFPQHNLTTYVRQIQYNIWLVPRSDQQFKILYDFFYSIAKRLDKCFPGHKQRKQPFLNLRFLCKPLNLSLVLFFFILFFKIIF